MALSPRVQAPSTRPIQGKTTFPRSVARAKRSVVKTLLIRSLARVIHTALSRRPACSIACAKRIQNIRPPQAQLLASFLARVVCGRCSIMVERYGRQHIQHTHGHTCFRAIT